MSCYIVTFDVATEATRERVRERLKSYGSFCPIHKHCWAIMADKKASEVRDDVGTVLQPGDRLFVVRSGTAAAWRHSYGEKNDAWLKKNL